MTEGARIGIWMMGILIFPVMVLLVVPACILSLSGDFSLSTRHEPPWNVLVTAGALFLCAAGFFFSLQSCLLFQRFGKGTAVPWVPPRRLVVRGAYRHTRNPMLSGVILILIGEVLFFASAALLLYLAIFLAGTLSCIAYKEEPTLHRRFGRDYDLYRRNVPRWIPRLTPWTPPWSNDQDS